MKNEKFKIKLFLNLINLKKIIKTKLKVCFNLSF